MKYLPDIIAGGFVLLSVFLFVRQFIKERRSLKLAVYFIAVLFSLIVAVAFIIAGFPDSLFSKISLIIAALSLVTLLFFPVFLVFSLFFSAVQMIRKEGHRPGQLLSLILGILYLAYLIVWPQLSNPFDNFYLRFIYIYLSFSFLYIAAAFALYCISSMLNLIKRPRRLYKYIIVLGSGLKDGMEVTPLLASRVDKGIEAFHENPGSILILSGGRGSDERLSESEAMFNYAVSRGVPGESILLEKRSTSTRENLLFSRELIEAGYEPADAGPSDGGGPGTFDKADLRGNGRDKGHVLVVSNRYHILRALLLARDLGFACDGRGAGTKLYFSINAFIREWAAYLQIRRKQFLTVLITVFLIMIILARMNMI